MSKRIATHKYNAALELFEDDPEEGLTVLATLIKQYPSDVSVRYSYGACLLQTGQASRALSHLEFATQRIQEPEPWQTLAIAYAELSMPVHAHRTLRKAIERGGDIGLPEDPKLTGDVPKDAREADLLEFERGRFEALYGNTLMGLSKMRNFQKRFPNYLPASNVIATATYSTGDLKQARIATEQSLLASPNNIHALLNLARLDLLEQGRDALDALRDRIVAAPVGDAAKISNGNLAKAHFFAMLEDTAQVEHYLNLEEPDAEQRLENPEMERLELRLLQQKGFKSKKSAKASKATAQPFFTPHELVPSGMVERWTKANPKTVQKTMLADLTAMPGWLELLPEKLGFDDSKFALVIALTLLEFPEPKRSHWIKVLRQVTLVGPGSLKTRMELLSLLRSREVIGQDEQPQATGDGTQVVEFKLHDEPLPWAYSEAEYTTFEKALKHMQTGNFKDGRRLLEPLAVAHPEHASIQFNLALSELHDAKLPNGETRGLERLGSLVQTHPEYLFAKAELAKYHIKNKDLELAKELLKMPQANEYHISEYAIFMSALGHLALAEGDREKAKELLEGIGQFVGDDSPAYLALEQALNTQSSFLSALGQLFKR
jgi:hypothetical protein